MTPTWFFMIFAVLHFSGDQAHGYAVVPTMDRCAEKGFEIQLGLAKQGIAMRFKCTVTDPRKPVIVVLPIQPKGKAI
jgi:hypothetical protein